MAPQDAGTDPGPDRSPDQNRDGDREPDTGRTVDARGKPCPTPVIELAKAVEDAPLGARVRLLADDPTAKVDVPVWCRMQSQTLVARDEHGDGWAFVVERST